jgi:hypothetical protein
MDKVWKLSNSDLLQSVVQVIQVLYKASDLNGFFG